jgi:exodeoxyribonuclease VII large subunit
VHLDVANESDWREAVGTAVQVYDRLDILVNNAGIVRRASIEETTLELWNEVMAVNATGVFLGTKHALPIMRRGGGSIEDLWGFNDERVIRAIFRCPVPVVSAVGHETDVTLTDMVADVRAPTPSAAAEIVAPHIREYRQHLRGEVSALSAAVSGGFAERQHSLHELQRRLSSHDPQWKLQQERLRVDRLGESLNSRQDQRLTRERSRLGGFSRQLALLDPRQLLGRGYALMNDPEAQRRYLGVSHGH